MAQERVAEMLDEWERGGRQGLCPVPDEPTLPKERQVQGQSEAFSVLLLRDARLGVTCSQRVRRLR